MYSAPWIRRLLPWLYVAIFLITAPLLLLYTSGYRYNWKKSSVERNGVLIVDGTPKQARIFIDGQDTGRTLPYTFQNIVPGWHTISLIKSGYHDWEKKLIVRGDQVTFINHTRLWPHAKPRFLFPADVLSLSATPDRTRLALIRSLSGRAGLQIFPDSTTKPLPLAGLTSTPLNNWIIRWNQDGSAFLIHGLSSQDAVVWSTIASVGREQLPPGFYHWSDQHTLVGSDDRSMTRLQLRSQRLTREQLPKPFLYRDERYALYATGTPPELVFNANEFRDRVYALSSVLWRLADVFRDQNLAIFKHQDSARWLAVNLQREPAYAGEIVGDHPRWWFDPDLGVGRALLLHSGEAWLWQPHQANTLLWRQSEPLQEIIWDTRGQHVILADARRVWALELDERDGREVTKLAEFDNIQDLDILKDTLYIAAEHQGLKGMWSMDLNP